MEETARLDKRQRDMEEKVKAMADMTRQIHAHLGWGNIWDKAALAQRMVEVARENKVLNIQKQKKRDIRVLEAERKVQEQKITWAEKARKAQPTTQQRKPPMTLDGAIPETQSPITPLTSRRETKIVMEVKVAYPGPGASWVGMKERLKGEIRAAF